MIFGMKKCPFLSWRKYVRFLLDSDVERETFLPAIQIPATYVADFFVTLPLITTKISWEVPSYWACNEGSRGEGTYYIYLSFYCIYLYIYLSSCLSILFVFIAICFLVSSSYYLLIYIPTRLFVKVPVCLFFSFQLFSVYGPMSLSQSSFRLSLYFFAL